MLLAFALLLILAFSSIALQLPSLLLGSSRDALLAAHRMTRPSSGTHSYLFIATWRGPLTAKYLPAFLLSACGRQFDVLFVRLLGDGDRFSHLKMSEDGAWTLDYVLRDARCANVFVRELTSGDLVRAFGDMLRWRVGAHATLESYGLNADAIAKLDGVALKPFVGDLFRRYFPPQHAYAYAGWIDVDVVFGDLSRYIDASLTAAADAAAAAADRGDVDGGAGVVDVVTVYDQFRGVHGAPMDCFLFVSGHMSLFRLGPRDANGVWSWPVCAHRFNASQFVRSITRRILGGVDEAAYTDCVLRAVASGQLTLLRTSFNSAANHLMSPRNSKSPGAWRLTTRLFDARAELRVQCDPMAAVATVNATPTPPSSAALSDLSSNSSMRVDSSQTLSPSPVERSRCDIDHHSNVLLGKLAADLHALRRRRSDDAATVGGSKNASSSSASDRDRPRIVLLQKDGMGAWFVHASTRWVLLTVGSDDAFLPCNVPVGSDVFVSGGLPPRMRVPRANSTTRVRFTVNALQLRSFAAAAKQTHERSTVALASGMAELQGVKRSLVRAALDRRLSHARIVVSAYSVEID